MSKQAHFFTAVLMILALVAPPGFAQQDFRHQLRYIEAINSEANLTDVYQQPETGQPEAEGPATRVKTVEQALERLRRNSRPLR